MAKDDAKPPPPKKCKHPAPLTYDNRVRLAKELLRNHPVIWDRKHPKFHSNSDKDAAWAAVASNLGFDLEVTCKEWSRFKSMHFTRQQRVNRGGAPAKTTQLHRLLDGLFSKDDSGESDLEEVAESSLQCRLCLRWTSNEELFDMFGELGPVIPKICTVLGIYLCEKPAGRKICAVCRQMVGLVEEFRTLCQLTNELEQVRIRVLDSADGLGWRSCASKVGKVCDSIRLQQRLVERAMKEGGHREEPEEIKQEVEEDGDGKEEEDRLKFSPVEIKKEEESSSDEEDSSSEGDSSEGESEDETTLCEVYKVVDGDGDDEPGQIKSEPEDEDPDEPPQSDPPETEPMTVDKERPASTHKFTADDRLRFARACLDYPILWKRSLPEQHANSKMRARNAAWDAIAAQFEITREMAKLEYKRLRNIHQGRGSRLASGELRPDDYLIVDPLFPVLCKMMGTPKIPAAAAAVSGKGKTIEPVVKQRRRQQRVLPNGERKERNRMDYQWSLRFAKEIDKLEPFWNVDHADHTRPTMTKLMASLANTMQCDVATVRREWKRLGEMHRRKLMGQAHGRKARHPSKEEDPLQTLLDKFFAHKKLETDGGDGDGRRFGVKPRFTDDGCIAQQRRGVFRYVKVCEECGKHVERSLFEAHMNRHRGVKPYECRFEGCGGRYTTRVNRDRHENIYHTREGFDIECDACGERFKHKSSLVFHYAVRHKSQNVPCGICQKVFKHDRNLDFHMQKQHSVKLTNYRKSMEEKKV